MSGDPGPYSNDEGDVWVPRTVPYLKARHIAAERKEYGDRLVYVGKADAILFGFTRDCYCEEYCSGTDDDESGDAVPCDPVPAWHFRVEEMP